jgi:hypothetical protein
LAAQARSISFEMKANRHGLARRQSPSPQLRRPVTLAHRISKLFHRRCITLIPRRPLPKNFNISKLYGITANKFLAGFHHRAKQTHIPSNSRCDSRTSGRGDRAIRPFKLEKLKCLMTNISRQTAQRTSGVRLRKN